MVIDGKSEALKLQNEIKEEIEKSKLKVTLAVVLVGTNAQSQLYVKNKKIACERVGIKSLIVCLDENISQNILNEKLKELSQEISIDAILLQLPLPNHLNENEALSYIDSKKDVDGLTTINMGSFLRGEKAVVPCTAKAVLYIVKTIEQNLTGKNVVIVGRSNLVGKPTALAFLANDATVTICHSKTKNLHKITSKADILISATGKGKLIERKHVKRGAIVIDVGISIDSVTNKKTGDVDFEKVKTKAKYITPVINGVGPLTVTMLLQNALLLAKQKNS